MKDEAHILEKIKNIANIKYKELESKVLSEKLFLESLRIKLEIKKKNDEPKYCKKCKCSKKKKKFCHFCGFYFCKYCMTSKRRKDPVNSSKFLRVCSTCETNFVKLYLFDIFKESLEMKQKMNNDNVKNLKENEEKINELNLNKKTIESNFQKEFQNLDKQIKNNQKLEEALKIELKNLNEELVIKNDIENDTDKKMKNFKNDLNNKKNINLEIKEKILLCTQINSDFIVQEEKLKKKISLLINSIYNIKNIDKKSNVEAESKIEFKKKPKLIKRYEEEKKIFQGKAGTCKCVIF